jgi:type I restriction enzyme R subunit
VRQIEVKGTDFDIADKITVSDFKQEQTGSYNVAEIESKPELKMSAPKPKKAETAQLKMLSVIIDEMNATYGNRFTKDVALKAAQTLIVLLMQNDRLKLSAKNNPIEDFKFTYENGIEDALVTLLDENTDFYTLLLSDREARERLTNPFMREIYEQLKKS